MQFSRQMCFAGHTLRTQLRYSETMTAIDFAVFVDRLASVSGETIRPFFRTALGVENKSLAGGFPLSPEEGRQLQAADQYPLEVAWEGMLVDDPGHPLDIEARVHKLLQVIRKDCWDAIEREACETLGVDTLRDYFRRPAGFFADHLKRYSKSRRQAAGLMRSTAVTDVSRRGGASAARKAPRPDRRARRPRFPRPSGQGA